MVSVSGFWGVGGEAVYQKVHSDLYLSLLATSEQSGKSANERGNRNADTGATGRHITSVSRDKAGVNSSEVVASSGVGNKDGIEDADECDGA